MALWIRQKKCCPMCKQHITHETGWNIHHIVEKHRGGNDQLNNLVLLHPSCHRQLHAAGKNWGAPLPPPSNQPIAG